MPDSNNPVFISGVIDFDTVTPLLEKASRDIDKAKNTLQFDLSKVTGANSAGLALMTNLLRVGREKNIVVQFLNIPENLLSAAKISNLDKLLLCNQTT